MAFITERGTRGSAFFAALAIELMCGSRARADTPSSQISADEAVNACATGAERAQSLRESHRLKEAAAELRTCAQSICPKVVRDDCQSWMREVDALMPTIAIRAIDSRGRDIIGVSVILDRRKIAGTLDGIAQPVDPGPHTLRFEARGGAIYEEAVLVTEAQKGES